MKLYRLQEILFPLDRAVFNLTAQLGSLAAFSGFIFRILICVWYQSSYLTLGNKANEGISKCVEQTPTALFALFRYKHRRRQRDKR